MSAPSLPRPASTGQLFELAGKIMPALPHLGLSHDRAQSLIADSSVLFRALEREGLCDQTNAVSGFKFTVDGTFDWLEYLSLANIRERDADYFKVPRYAGTPCEVEAGLHVTDGWPGFEELRRIVLASGLRPVSDIHTLFAFMAAYPDEMNKIPIVAPSLTIKGLVKERGLVLYTNNGTRGARFWRKLPYKVAVIGLK